MKTCSKCGHTLPLCDFHKSNGKRRADCKKCYNSLNNRKKNNRSNEISRLSYLLAGGSRQFYQLPKDKREALRTQATELHATGSSFVSADNARRVRNDGFVYVIHHPQLVGVKIGRAFDPASRLRNYQTGCPQRAYKLYYTSRYIKDCVRAEKIIHGLLDADRLEGEWFSTDKKVAREVIKKIAEGIHNESID